MSELAANLPFEAPFSARLHTAEPDPRTNVPSYLCLRVHGLEEPHLDALRDAMVTDPRDGITYPALEVPHLLMVDFPDMAHPRAVTYPWLSYEKRELYKRALQLGEVHEAERMLGNWPDAHLRSTHFVIGAIKGQLQFMNANKLLERDIPVELAEKLLVFTVGSGKDNKTPATSAVRSRASKLGVLPRPTKIDTLPTDTVRSTTAVEVIEKSLEQIRQESSESLKCILPAFIDIPRPALNPAEQAALEARWAVLEQYRQADMPT